jgi:hypothetical protein
MLRHLKYMPTVAVTAAFVGATLLGVSSGPASASTVNAVATLARPGTSTYLASGGSATQFTVSLPSSAACDGDTASRGYHVFSYLVPKGTNLSTVTFGEAGPSVGYGIVDVNGDYYGSVNTAIGTGQVIEIPNDFEWAPLVTRDGLLSSLLGTTGGVWETGLACATTTGAFADNWNSQVTFKSSKTDPNGFVWTDVPGPSGSAVAAITSAAHVSFVKGTTNHFTVKASGTPKPVLTESGTLPAGVSVDDTTGVLSGKPTVAGVFPITFTATNGIGTPAVQHFTLTTEKALSITTKTLPTATVKTPYKATLKASGGTAPDKWTLVKGTLPTGLQLTTAGVLKGTPTVAATSSFTVKVTDASSPALEATKAYTLTVT